MPAGRIAAIVLDVDGTLYDPAPVRRQMSLAIARFALIHPLDGFRTLRAIGAYRRAHEELRAADMPGAPLRQIEAAAHAAKLPEAWMAQTVRRWMEEAPLEAVARARFPGVLEFCRWASGEGIALGVLSDYPAREKVKALGLSGYIEAIGCAQDPEIGCFKPRTEGLLAVLKRLHVEPARAAYVGDRPEVDGALALAAGVRGFLLTGRSAAGNLTCARSWPELQAAISAAR